MSDSGKAETERYQTRGEHLLGRVQELIHEGNVRRIIIRNEEGRRIVELPLSVGVVGAALAPALAAVGAIAALVTDCTIEVLRRPTRLLDDPEGGRIRDD
jgi:hypothetical protein